MEKENIGEKKFNFFDKFARVLSIIMMFAYLLFVLNNTFNFLPAGDVWMDVLINLIYYGPLAIMVLTTFDDANSKSKIIKYAILIIWVAIILFSVSPDLFGLIKV